MKNFFLKGGLNKNLIYKIKKRNIENKFFFNKKFIFLQNLKKIKLPDWCFNDLSIINYNKLFYFSSASEINSNLINKIKKINLKNKYTKIIDLIFDSNSIFYTMKDFLEKQGIIYISLYKSLKIYFKIINKYINNIVFIYDNFFSIINSIIYSEGSFCYIYKNILCIFELNTFFFTNTENFAQFEKTLIIVNKNSIIYYLEGCTAPKYKESQLHSAVVELFINYNSKINYYTIQNWYKGNNIGEGGIYNLTTKRGICMLKAVLNWVQIETGSFLTWKYPSSILLNNFSYSLFYSITFLSNTQQVDTGSKIYHIYKNTYSNIISKSISLNYSVNVYRGNLDIKNNSYNSKNLTQCSSIIIGYNTLTVTIPYIKVNNYKIYIEQETYISKLNILQIFYFLQRYYKYTYILNIFILNFINSYYYYIPNNIITELSYLIFIKINECIF
eukprot:GHVQ01030668.1.p1 GENE.GHVQ01030668.1~~GHVQ01030668.1.p1  ORF type:complete len:444 (+),score=-55.27 GHVQ01030668.1:15992-17323(+)